MLGFFIKNGIAVVSTILHRCRKSNTYQLLTFISNASHLKSYNLMLQKYELVTETHKMTIVWVIGLCTFLLYNERISYENTYDIRAILTNYLPSFQNQDIIISQIQS